LNDQLSIRGQLVVWQAIKQAVNQRRHSRRASGAAGLIHLHDSGKQIPCRVQDRSLGGACLELEDPSILPSFFVLLVPAEHIERQCTLVWRDKDRAGVRFR
jgi:PilZ domain